MGQSGASIEAILRLNTKPFLTSLNESKSAVNNFKNALGRWGTDTKKVESGLFSLQKALSTLIPYLNRFKNLVDQTKTFRSFANGLKTMSEAVMNFSNVTKTSQVGMIRIKEIIQQWSNAVKNLQVSVKGEIATEEQEIATLSQLRNAYNSTYMTQEKVIVPTKQYAQALELTRPKMREYITQAIGIENANNRMGNSTSSAIAKLRSVSGAMNQGTSSANRMASATSRLGKVMSSLRMVGTMVGSMLAYNFAHKLLVATGETIHAKSEMEGYFKMLNFGKSDVADFNNALDQTVQQFQRVNKYSLGETISSIGVEFNLTTEEMKKAMKVTSMITSEYLRAGRNANEASLAVKDVLQGQFQRLSRETGVKGEDLKKAGWSGDTKDVLGLMEALEKVGMSRNWDVFAEKANSLNDILTILQNRFGEWSADMVYSVQPAILGVFNALMDVGGMFAQTFTGIWEWLNGGSWGAIATQFTAITVGIGVLSQALVMYRAEISLVEASQLGLKNSITALIFGLKAQQIAEVGVRNSIMAKILGVKAETVAQHGVTTAINEKLVAVRMESAQNLVASTKEDLKTLAVERNTIAEELNTLQQDLNIASTENLITAKEAETMQERLNTAQKELNTAETIKQEVANGGLTASLIALGGAENVAAVASGELSVAMGVLNGVFALSPIGWLTAGVLALAGAFYVLTGGLDAHWDKMKQFNDMMENSDSIIQQNNDYLKELGETIGTDKKAYQDTADAVDNFNKKLGSSKAVVKAYNDELALVDTKLTAGFESNMKAQGLDDSAVKKFREYGVLDEGYNTYYHAWQVMNKQEENALKTQDEIIQKMKDRKAKGEEIGEKSAQIKQHEDNLIKHSAEHNTSDDWWGGTWAGMLAGLDSAQLWLDYATEDLATWVSDFNKLWEDLPNQIGQAVGNIDWGALGNIGENFGKWIDDVKKSIGDSFKGLTDWFGSIGESFSNFGQSIIDFIVGGIKGFDFLGGLTSAFSEAFSSFDLLGTIMGFIFPDPVSAADGGDTPSFMEDLSSIFGFDVQNWINNFMSDPLGTLGVQPIDIGQILFPQLFGLVDGAVGIATWVDTNLIQPLKTGISTGIASIPILSDVLGLLGWIPQAMGDAQSKGQQLMRAFGNAVEQIIASIPILSDILRMLGIIPQANPTASSNGHGVGQAIKDGFKNGITGIVDIITGELNHIVDAIKGKIEEARKWASELGGAIVNGVKGAIDPGSPGIIARDIIGGEFGTYIPQVILENSDKAYLVAQEYGTKIKEGISSVGTTMSFDGMVDTYESDAQIVAESSQLMGVTTTTAFNDMTMQVNASTSQMQTNVSGAYNSIATNQNTMLNNMKTRNTSAYNEMYQRSNQSLIQMRDSTSNITHQMTNAWNQMKNNIVASAQQLQHDSTVHFNNLSNTIGSFYRKIQNPSSWGGSPHGGSTHRNVGVGKAFASSLKGRYAGGRGSTYTGSRTMTVAQLKKKICPSGDCDGIFDGYSATERVDVRQFLSMISEGGFGGWDFAQNHYNYIKDTSDEWSMKSPTIQLKGGIPTNADYYVKDFENGEPKISWNAFQSMAESIFTAIPYRFYYNSDWKGSWLGALQAGACNCWDGAHAILAFANSCGFSGSIQSGTWVDPDGTTYPHVFAVINGKKMDTTGWQNRRSWSAGSPNIRTASHNPPSTSNNNAQRTVNITLNFNEPVYGVDDLDSRIKNGVKEGLREEFNDPYTVVI